MAQQGLQSNALGLFFWDELQCGGVDPVAAIGFGLDIRFAYRSKEAWPTGAGNEFSFRAVQRRAAADADVRAFCLGIPILAAERTLCAALASDVVLGRSEFPAPSWIAACSKAIPTASSKE